MAVVPFQPKGGATPPPPGDDLEDRVKSLESDMTDIKVLLGKIEMRLDSIDRNMATKVDLSESERRINEKIHAVDVRVGKIEGALDAKLGYWDFVKTGVGMIAVSVTLTGAVGALLIRWGPWIASLGK